MYPTPSPSPFVASGQHQQYSTFPQPRAGLVERLLDLVVAAVRREREACWNVLGLLDPQVERYGWVARGEEARELLDALLVGGLSRVVAQLRSMTANMRRRLCTCITT